MLRLVFAGTPAFAATALEAIVDAGHDVVRVLTRIDRPGGRGQALQESAVKQLARARGLVVEQPGTLRDPVLQERLRALDADVMVVAAYGAILPPEVLAIPRHGCLNVHASLLPRWRGAAPIQRAIEAGDRETGITIMRMDEGLDTGAIVLVEREAIRPDDTGASLHDRLATLGAHAIVAALASLEDGTSSSTPQPEDGVTYARKLDKADAPIDWSLPAQAIVDRVRAFDPVPGSTATLDGPRSLGVKVWRARVVAPAPDAFDRHARHTTPADPGRILDARGRIVVATGDAGAVELLELQKPGGRRLAADEFLRGSPLEPGARFVASRATQAAAR